MPNMPPARRASRTRVPVTTPRAGAATQAPDPVPRPVGVDQRASPSCGTIGQKTQRPKQHQSRRQHDQREGRGHHDADRAGQAEAAGRRGEREQQREQAEEDGGRAASTASRRAAQCAAPSRRAGTRSCAARRGSGRSAAARSRCRRRRRAPRGCRWSMPSQATPDRTESVGRDDGGDPVRDAHDGERHDPQHRAAVGHHQQDRDDQHGRQQESQVGAVEDLCRGRPGWPRAR